MSGATSRFGFTAALVLIAFPLLNSHADAQTASSVTCSPSIIAGGSGNSATCTVTLSGAAPSGGTVVTLASSLIELAATLPAITIPAGQSSGTFTVATNGAYRPYSGLGFDATITASASGATRSTIVSVTAAPKPADFSSGSQAGSNTQWDGLMCGGIAPINGQKGILYSCSRAQGTGFGTCTFQQECTIGCRRAPPGGTTFNDFCATSGPEAVAVSRAAIVSGDRVPASIVLEAPAGQAPDREQGVPGTVDQNFNASFFPHAGGIPFPNGATSVPFDVATSYVPTIQFVDVVGYWFNASIPPFLITNGRAGHKWLVMVPPNPPPAAPITTLGDFQITGSNPITGGNSTIGQIDMSGLSRSGGPTFTVTSSHPAIVPTQTFTAPASQNLFGFQAFIQTKAPAADTSVTVTATDGRYSFSRVLTVRSPGPPPVLSGVSVSPTSVVGGNSATGTVTLSAPQSGSTVVTLSTPAPATVAQMPASVTVPAGATSKSFTITTSPVSSQFNMNIFADLAGSPERQALLLITAGGGGTTTPTLSALSVTPTSVTGGSSATGTVTLTAAAPAGGATVSLSDNSAATTVPASVAVPAGATSASFTITTTSVTASTSATISAVFGGVTRTAAVTVNPAATTQTATLTVTASGRSGERVTSSPAGISVAVGSSGSASFTAGTSITLSVSNGRDAIWSGACSSGGNKTKTCTFTINDAASVSANVQ